MDSGDKFDAGDTEVGSPGPGSNFLPQVLLDDWGGNTPEAWGIGFEMGIGWFRDLVLAAGGVLDSDATSSGNDDASESSPFAIAHDLVVTFMWRETGKFVGNGSVM